MRLPRSRESQARSSCPRRALHRSWAGPRWRTECRRRSRRGRSSERRAVNVGSSRATNPSMPPPRFGSRALFRAGQIGRIRLPGDVDVPASGMNGDAVSVVDVRAAEIRRLEKLCQARVQAIDEEVGFPGHDGLGPALRSGKIDLVGPADDVDVATGRMNGDAVNVVGAARAEVRALNQSGQRTIESRDEPVGIAGERVIGRVCAADGAGEVVRPSLPCHVDVAARGVNRQGVKVFGSTATAAAQVGRLQQRAEGRVEPGDEAVAVKVLVIILGRCRLARLPRCPGNRARSSGRRRRPRRLPDGSRSRRPGRESPRRGRWR